MAYRHARQIVRPPVPDRAKGLFFWTCVLDLVALPARLLVAYVFAGLASYVVMIPVILVVSVVTALVPGLEGEGFDVFFVSLVGTLIVLTLAFAFAPPLLGLLALLGLPGGTRWTRAALGARQPSERERKLIVAALEQIGGADLPALVRGVRPFVVDRPTPNAFVVGNGLYLTRGLVQGEHLPAVLAHEIGHWVNGDGRVVLALKRLHLPPFDRLSRASNVAAVLGGVSRMGPGCLIGLTFWLIFRFLALAAGGFGQWVLKLPWTYYLQERELLADRYAWERGQGPQLVEFLEQHEFLDIATPFYARDHPYVEQRIDQLLGLIGSAPYGPTWGGGFVGRRNSPGGRGGWR